MTYRPSRLIVLPSRLVRIAGVCAIVALPAVAHAQTAAALYATVYGQETSVRTATPAPTLAALRSVIAAYERVVRKYPASAYSDNALWQAAGVASFAHESFGEQRDLDSAERFLQWLQQEYPSSSLAKQVPTRLAALHAPAPMPSPTPAVQPVVMNITPAPAPTPSSTTLSTGRPAAAGPAATIKSITHSLLPRGDRITIEISDEVSYAGDRIVSPDRVYVDFRNASAPSAIAQQAAAMSAQLSGTLIKTLRVGQPVAGTARLTMELADNPRYSVFAMYQPFRLVIDIERTLPPPAQPPVVSPTPPPVAPGNRNAGLLVPAAFPTAHGSKPSSTPSATPAPMKNATAPPQVTPTATESTVPAAVVTPSPSATPTPTPTPSPISTPTSFDSSAMDPPVTTGLFTPMPSVSSIAPPPKSTSPVRPTTPPPSPSVVPGPNATTSNGKVDGKVDKDALISAPPTAPIPTPTPTTIAVAPSTTHGDYSIARQLGLGVSRIVIDPGHGGHDPGAQGNGITEADLVLDISLRLEALLLEQPGFEVVLTRRTDEFVALEERTAFANRQGADLFLSIHANASRQSATRGIETYFLNFANNPAAEAVAARENATSGKVMGDLPDILKSVALNNKLAESREMADQVQQSLVNRLKEKNKDLRDLGVKQALFVVLIGAQMPSVLSEISFLTNKGDAALLKQPAYRQGIAQSLCDAIVKYRDALKKVTPVAAKAARK